MKIKIILFVLAFTIVSSLAGAYEFYSDNFVAQYQKTIKNPTEENLNSLYKAFIINKGISDKTVAYGLVEALINHPEKINDKTISAVINFNKENASKIKAILSQSFVDKILGFYLFFDKFSIFVILKYVSSIFIFITMLYLLFKNYYIFFHSHKFKGFFIGVSKLLAFIVIIIVCSVIFNNHMFAIVGGFCILLLAPEKINFKTPIIIATVIFVLINSVDYLQSPSSKSLYLDIVNKPVSKEYLISIAEKNDSPMAKIIAAIKYPELITSYKNISFNPKDRFEAGNYAVYLLMTEDIDKFNKIAKEYNLLEDPIILINVASLFSKNFKYEEYEETIKNLYTFYPEYHKLLQTFQINLNSYVFLPYFTEIYKVRTKLYLDYVNIIVFSILLIIGLVTNNILSKFRFFRCTQCGESFCVKCDDGYLHNNVCEKCRILSHKIAKADAVTLVKKQFQVERYRQNKNYKNIILTFVAPGADRLLNNQPIAGILMVLIHSIFIFIVTFRGLFFISPENIGFHLVIKYLYYIYGAFFIIAYILNIFVKRDFDGV